MGQVIQAFFVGGVARAEAVRVQRAPAAAAAGGHPRPGPPAPAFLRSTAMQRRTAPGRPPLPGPVHAPGGTAPIEIDPARLGLARGGGAGLPQALLAKMEAAFGADFSAVRVHVGPQAGRIGALAFTTGNDIYFAPGRFQPDSISGQQLIGHELVHVIQQRQGRVAGPATGMAVVQDRMLEAEADRLGMRAAAYAMPLQRATVPPITVTPPPAAIQCSKRGKAGPNGNCAPTDLSKYTKVAFGPVGVLKPKHVHANVRLALHAANPAKVAKAKAQALVIPVSGHAKRDDAKKFNDSVLNCETQMWDITKTINNGPRNAKHLGALRAKQTEVIGEVAGLRAMSSRYPKYQLALRVAPGHGAGIDQLWVKRDLKTKAVTGYLVVEAKGPNQKLSKGQMSAPWLRKKMNSLANSKNPKAAKVAKRVVAALNAATGVSVRGRVIRARWNDKSGGLTYSVSDKMRYR